MPREGSRAFTLLELLVVVAIVGMISALVVPRLLASLPGVQLKATARAVAASLRYARGQAVFETTPYVVALDRSRGLLIIEPAVSPTAAAPGEVPATPAPPAGQRVYALPEGIEVHALTDDADGGADPARMMLFFPRGDSSGGRLVLRNPERREVAITVDPITGAVAVDRL